MHHGINNASDSQMSCHNRGFIFLFWARIILRPLQLINRQRLFFSSAANVMAKQGEHGEEIIFYYLSIEETTGVKSSIFFI